VTNNSGHRNVIEFRPIGIIHTPFRDRASIPPQPHHGRNVVGTIELYDEYRDGLDGLEGFSHLILLFHLHRSVGYEMKTIPRGQSRRRGLFATRSPRRPNPIGLSIVRLVAVDLPATIRIEDCDMFDGSPLLDIKPYVPACDRPDYVRTGWIGDREKETE